MGRNDIKCWLMLLKMAEWLPFSISSRVHCRELNAELLLYMYVADNRVMAGV